jgi:hypothetical protein
MLSALKVMASARSVRDIDNYLKGTDKIVKAFNNYDKSFRDFYLANVKGFLDKVDLSIPVPPTKVKELEQQPVPAEAMPSLVDKPATIPAKPSPTAFDNTDTVENKSTVTTTLPMKAEESPLSTWQSPVNSEADTMQAPPPSFSLEEDEDPEFKSDQIAKELWGKTSHQKFLHCLEALANEDPMIVKSYIKKYATLIQKTQPTLASNLFKLANTSRR